MTMMMVSIVTIVLLADDGHAVTTTACRCDDHNDSSNAVVSISHRETCHASASSAYASASRHLLRYRNLVFEGGGMKGLSHVGALKALAKRGYYDETRTRYTFEKVAGTSVGCLFALIAALDIAPDRLERYVLDELDFYSLLSDNSSFVIDKFPRLESRNYFSFVDYIKYTYRLLSYTLKLLAIWQQDDVPGIDNGTRFLLWLRTRLFALSPHAPALARFDYNPTLEQLRALTGHSLICYASRLVKTDMVRLSPDSTPHALVADVVYVSCSLPMLFKPIYDEEGYPLVDGGVLNNFPIYEFDNDAIDASSTLGLSLHVRPSSASISSFGNRVDENNNDDDGDGDECVCRVQRQKRHTLDRRQQRMPPSRRNRIVRNLDFMRKLVEAALQDRDYLQYTRDPRNCDRVVYLASSLSTLEMTADREQIRHDIAEAERRTLDFLSEDSSRAARRVGDCMRYARRV